MKTCSKCGIRKDFSEFHRSSQTKDGFNYWCKSCRLEYKRVCRRSYDVPMLLNGVPTDDGWLVKCTNCGEFKDFDGFAKDRNKKFGYHSWCKACQKERKSRNPERSSIRNRKRNFGISENGYLILLESQGSRCAICGVHVDNLKKSLAVDHSHETGNIRGLLCTKCNVGLGHFQDSQALIMAAAEYLEEFDE